MDKRTADALCRVLATAAGQRHRASSTLRQYHADHGSGKVRGESIYFTEADQTRIREHLKGQGFGRYAGGDLSGLDRAEVLAFVPNEKMGNRPVKQGRVCVKALGNAPVQLEQGPLWFPRGSHLDINCDELARLHRHRSVLVVENWETFEQLHDYRLTLTPTLSDPLAIYRGDETHGQAVAFNRFLAITACPVMSFPDLDPAGLLIAAAYPRLTGVLAPAPAALDAVLRSPEGRRDLFQRQVEHARPVLQALPAEHPCRCLWGLVLETRSAVTQERWKTLGVECVLWREEASHQNPLN